MVDNRPQTRNQTDGSEKGGTGPIRRGYVSISWAAKGQSMAGSAKGGGVNAPAAKGTTVDGDASGQAEDGEGPGLDRVIQAQIGDKLRAMYGGLVEQPVPDKLAALIEQLSRPGSERT